ncbi:T9SS type A sorting domain-containing protein [Mucilaginibacter sp. UR6-11]|uniref:T9SS type A sorting domain-containing protein n=1 Tax=Mucilaginibacter sp. UR6-11 TaxID=1435644 RepID=UPI001E31D39B|nr:T9SS type A sorting domain-containing protein [Mucilaginibacter sp. UR6-11]MCC8425094.1 T9SS type A sorting domain-containing protein [Mucilaginibacter sp. UR6-11]
MKKRLLKYFTTFLSAIGLLNYSNAFGQVTVNVISNSSITPNLVRNDGNSYAVFGFDIQVGATAPSPAIQGIRITVTALTGGGTLNSSEPFSSFILYKSNTGSSTYTPATVTSVNVSGSNTNNGIQFQIASGLPLSANTHNYYFLVVKPSTNLNQTSFSTGVFDINNGLFSDQNFTTGTNIAHATYATSTANFAVGRILYWTANNATSATTAVWSNTGNWTESAANPVNPATAVPNAGDIVIIGKTVAYKYQPLINAAASAGSITIGTTQNTSGTLSYPTLTVNSTLTVTGAITQTGNWSVSNTAGTFTTTITGTGTITATTLNVGDGVATVIPAGANQPNTGLTFSMTGTGALTLSGDLNIVSSTNTNGGFGPGNLLVSSGTITCARVVTSNSTGIRSSLSMSGGTLNLTGSTPFSLAGGTNYFAFGSGSTVNYSGTNQTLFIDLPQPGGTTTAHYYNLNFGGSGTKSPNTAGTLAIDGNLTTAANSTPVVDFTVNNSTITVAGSVTNVSGATIKQGTNPLTITGALNNAGTFTGGPGQAALNVGGAFTNSGSFTPGTGTVTFNGDYTNSSVFNYSAGTIVFNNSAANASKSVTDNSTAGTLFNNVTFTGSDTTNAPINLLTAHSGKFSVSSTGLLKLSNATTKVAAGNGLLTLKSDVNGSATVDVIQQGSRISGNVKVERFITGGSLTYRGYRLLSSPVATTTGAYSLSYLKGSGSYLTGAGGPANGFDAMGNPTIYAYREDIPNTALSGSNYRAVTKINNTPASSINTVDGDSPYPLYLGTGILFFYRGNNSTSASTPPNSLALTQTGYLNQGTITFKNWYTGAGTLSFSSTDQSIKGFNLAGNPYASSIDWNTHWNNTTATNSGTGIQAYNLGHSVYIYNAVTKNYSIWTSTGPNSGTAAGSPGASNIIPAGQGFFVLANGAGAKLIFNESAKVTAKPANLLLNAAEAPVDRHLRVQLAKDSVNKDETVVMFNSTASAEYSEDKDALYLRGSGLVNLSSTSSNHRLLGFYQLPLPKKSQAISLNIAVAGAGAYQLSLTEATNMPDVIDVWLKDAYKKDSLDIKHNPKYNFTVSADTNTAGSRRFSLVIKLNQARMVHLLNFTASKNADDVKLTWRAENEANYTTYILQRSTDNGKSFLVLDSLTSVNSGTYNDLDPSPVKGLNQYRLKQIDLVGNVSYSNIVNIMYAQPAANNIAGDRIKVYPNPASTTINLAIKTATETAPNYKITIINSSGVIVKTAISSSTEWHGDVNELSPGIYFIKVMDSKEDSITGKNTFIKL